MRRLAFIVCFLAVQLTYMYANFEFELLPFGGNMLFALEQEKNPHYDFYVGLAEFSVESDFGLGLDINVMEMSYSPIYSGRLSFLNTRLFYHFHFYAGGSGLLRDVTILMPFVSISYLDLWNNAIVFSAGIRFSQSVIAHYVLYRYYSFEAGYRLIDGKHYVYAGVNFELLGLISLMKNPAASSGVSSLA